MTVLQAHAVAADILENWKSDQADDFTTILTRLTCFVPGALDGLHRKIAERKLFYPGILYLGADPKTRDALIARVDPSFLRYLTIPTFGNESLRLNHLLICLAWIGDSEICRLFSHWRAKPPSWQSKLHIPAFKYAQCAGWELTAAGTRRELYSPEAFRLQPPPAANRADDAAVGVMLPRTDRCGWCNSPLTTLFEFNPSDPRFAWLGVAGDRLPIPFCHRCSCYCMVYFKIDPGGPATWHPANERPSFNGSDSDTYDPLPVRPLVLGPRRRSIHETYLQAWAEGPFSQIGGSGLWWQGESFPECPECRCPMALVGQLTWEDVIEYSEGTTYACLCAHCRVVVTSYPQT